MKRVLDQLRSREFAAFLAAGGFAAIINIAARVLLNPYLGFQAAIIVAYGVAMAAAFLINRRFVFAASDHKTPAHEAFFFVLVNSVALAQVWLVSVALFEFAFPLWDEANPEAPVPRPRLLAHMIGVASPILTSYFGHRHLSFRRSGS